MILYADTSAIIRAYLPDEPDHAELRHLLLEGSDPVVTSELTRVEFASATTAAQRAQRLESPQPIHARFDHDCTTGPITVLRLTARVVLPAARHLIATSALRTLDAIHLAVALRTVPRIAAGDPVVMVTRDRNQAKAAEEQGLEVR